MGATVSRARRDGRITPNASTMIATQVALGVLICARACILPIYRSVAQYCGSVM